MAQPRRIVRQGHLTREQYQKFIECVEEPLHQLLFDFWLYTGARLSESLNFRKNQSWMPYYAKDTDHDDKGLQLEEPEDGVLVITVPSEYSKHHEEDELYINDLPFIMRLIQHINQLPHNAYVFPILTQKKGYETILRERVILEHAIADGLRKAGLYQLVGRVTPHAFRRTRIKWDEEDFGGQISLVQLRARHKDVRQTMEYAKRDSEELQRMLRRNNGS